MILHIKKWLVRNYLKLVQPHPFSDLMSLSSYLNLRIASLSAAPFVQLNLTNMGSKPFIIRNRNKTDLDCLSYVFQKQFHIPPFDLPQNSTILDLGCNIGATVWDFRRHYPNARIIGYEMDRDNFELCLSNNSEDPNTTLVNKAIAAISGHYVYNKYADPDAFSLTFEKEKPQVDKDAYISVEAIDLTTLIQEHGLQKVDYLKMDIEGAELEIFKHPLDWLQSVNALNIEIHEAEMLDPVIELLERVGFMAWKDDRHWSAIFAKRV